MQFQKKTYSNFTQNCIKVLCNDCITFQINKHFQHQKQLAKRQGFKGQTLFFNHRILFDTKGPI